LSALGPGKQFKHDVNEDSKHGDGEDSGEFDLASEEPLFSNKGKEASVLNNQVHLDIGKRSFLAQDYGSVGDELLRCYVVLQHLNWPDTSCWMMSRSDNS
jgi:hypothetical protein